MFNPWWTFVVMALTIVTNHRCSGKAIDQLSDSFSRQTMGPFSTNTEEVQKQVLNLNETLSDEVTQMLLKDFNLSVSELKRQHDLYKARKNGNQDLSGLEAMPTTEMSKFSTTEDEFKSRKKSQVKTMIEEVRNNSVGETHEFSYPPNCSSLPTVFNSSEWFDLNPKSWNIFIMPRKLREPSVTSVVMRIFKKLTDNHVDTSNVESKVDELYTVTLSIYAKKRILRADQNKQPIVKIMNEIGRKLDILMKIEIGRATILKDHCGWIEFSVPSLRKHWESAKNNLGLAVDIFDSNMKPLVAKDHFSLQSCEEGPSIPWSIVSELFGQNPSPCLPKDQHKMFKNARIDLIAVSISSSSNRGRHARNIHSRHHHHQGHLRHLTHSFPHTSER